MKCPLAFPGTAAYVAFKISLSGVVMHGSGFSPTIQEAGNRRTGTHALRLIRAALFFLIVVSPEFLAPPCAAQIRISGRVLTVDSTPVYRAIVRLRDAVDSTVTARVLTGEQGEFSFILSATDELPHGVPSGMSLSAFPNPSNGITRLRFLRADRAFTRLVIVDMLGRGIATLADETLEAGEYETAWDGRVQGAGNAAAGMYLAVLSDNRSAVTRTILLTGSGHTSVSPAVLRRIGTPATLRKSTGAINILLDVADTTAALPRFVSKTGITFQILSDTSVTILVDYGAPEDLGFPAPNPGRMRLDGPWLYVCCGTQGLWRRNVETMTAWQFLGLSDTTPGLDRIKIVDVAADADTIVAASSPRWQKGLPRDSLVSVWKSENGGQTWFRADRGIVETVGTIYDWNYILSISRSPHFRRVAVARTLGGVYFSIDGATTWKFLGGDRSLLAEFSDFFWNPYLIGEVWMSCGSGGIFGESGKSFSFRLQGDTLIQNVSFDPYIFSLAFSPTDPNIMYASPGYKNIIHTTDGGITWELFEAPGAISFLREHPLRGDMLFEGMGTAVDLIRLPEYRRQVIVKQSGLDQGRFCVDGKGAFIYIGDGTRIYRLFVGDYN